MVGPRHYGLASDGLDGSNDLVAVGRDHNPAGMRLNGTAPDMHDHRLAMDVSQRLAGQARGLHPGGNND